MLVIKNNHEEVESTNYFDSELALNGYLYLTWNAGAARLLVPDLALRYIEEMKTGKYAVFSRGRVANKPEIEATEILFEDDSSSPFSILLDARQDDRMLPENQQGSGFDLLVYTRAGLQLTLPAKYRHVLFVPCNEKWSEQ